jgi:alkanesulfonate monooxygenase SsuD/methylene tetrahydromethanopterin reductase-like flavin-dependent oxidoreductase (luciferase family)
MDFGLVLQTDPPADLLVERMVRAEAYGFTHGWTFDSVVLWQEPFVIYSRILERTERLVVGPMVTNPGTRAWEVTASLFATLNDMFGNRTVCGIGRGDSAMRVAGRRADGFVLQLADPYLTEWMVAAVRAAAAGAGRDPASVKVCVAAPAYVTDGSPEALAHAREQCRWFGGMVGNHVADLVARYGESGAVPQELTDYIRAREGYDYSHHGRVDNPDTRFVPDAIVDRFCLVGPVEEHVAKLERLRSAGVDQFAVYAMHDDVDGVVEAYGRDVVPALS